jgi:hypothetical protein
MKRWVTAAELAKLLHRGSAKWRALVMLRAFFDESGTDGTRPVVSISGYVGTESQWTSLEGEWQQRLDNFGVKEFHMAPCLAGEAQFRDMEKANRDQLVYNMLDIIRASKLQAIWSGVDAVAWKEEVKDEDFLKVYRKPFLLCFADIIRQLKSWSASEADGETVAPVFAEQKEYEQSAREIYEAYISTKSRDRFFKTLTFSSPSDLIPLQTADTVVWLVRDEWTDRDPRKELELHARAFDGSAKAYGAFFDRASLARAVSDFRAVGDC